MKKFDILIVGVGGQGVILASNVLCDAAMAAGYDVKKTDTLGMAQRGGSVVSHLRFDKEVCSPLIPKGQTDLIIAFEKLEAARYMEYLGSQTKAVVNDMAMPPASISLGLSKYPADSEILDGYTKLGIKADFIAANDAVKELGNTKMLNIYLLGYAAHYLPFGFDILADAIKKRLPSKLLEGNLKALEAGYAASVSQA
ncbi:indolepyruvate oxidoreductase subunit beta [Dehalococcoides mccartyi]|uniref:Indolepyruvate ferredoxin oxidoreductase, beta subunit n=1 Tax=Dehalococcoides mccartyi (strain VS) TaxID=311424 RepID=D2BHZ9_DEHMV|nr:indolepyruvate oxidoreductase subunit beta [Dehalococcoides mccartyi]ACZ61949.1 indolepyruvate ferredoxin oxidoreductase, beta subunit [Dehalococcoides mccartyi VS]